MTIQIEIPGRGLVVLHHAVFDINGTLTVDGQLIEGVDALIAELKQRVEVHLLTADTFGAGAAIGARLGVASHHITGGGAEKARIVRELGAAHVAAIGNGANDAPMFNEAALAIAVLGEEGLSVEALQAADVAAQRIHDAIRLLLTPKRLVATLRR